VGAGAFPPEYFPAAYFPAAYFAGTLADTGGGPLVGVITIPLSVQCGSARSGQAANVRYTVTDSSGVVRVGPTGAGIAEKPDGNGALTTGAYGGTLSGVQVSWLPVVIDYTIVGVAGFIASDTVGAVLHPNGLDGVAVESGVNFRQAQSAILAESAGNLASSGGDVTIAAGNNPAVRRITATTDQDGQRAVTLNLPS
jgi:hypothetical protein